MSELILFICMFFAINKVDNDTTKTVIRKYQFQREVAVNETIQKLDSIKVWIEDYKIKNDSLLLIKK
ncbi:MAG: hypothetical protein WCT77_00345 [Bacteroidota bacterium]